jgi:translation initiation factor 5
MSDVYLPILKDNRDPHYRYKMPKLTAKIEGSGNGIKTVITNMSAVAKSICRPPAFPTKYFGCELGAQTTITTATDLYIVNGSHDVEKLQNLLYKFIKQFVLCSKCSNPETSLTIVKSNINQKCIACGYDTVIPKSLHKLTTYIINHPPDSMVGASGTAAAGGKATKVAKSESSSKSKSSKSGKSGSSPPTAKSSTTNGSGGDTFVNNNDEDGFDDAEFETSAYAERMRELTDGFSNGIYASDARENANIFYKLVKERKEAGQLGDAAVQKELVREAERLDIKDKATLVLSELLFTENILAEIETYRLVLLRFCHENRKAQKYLLGGYEKLVGDVYKDKLLAKAAVIMKALYDQDILDEETCIEWAAKESKKYVSKEMSRQIHEKVAPFIKWLKEAESEVSEEDEDDDDDDDEDDEQNSDGGASSKSNDSATDTGKKVNGNGPTVVANGNGKVAAVVAGSNVNGNGIVKKRDEDEDDEDEVEFSHRVSGIRLQEVVQKPAVANPVAAVAAVAANGDGTADAEDIDIDNI